MVAHDVEGALVDLAQVHGGGVAFPGEEAVEGVGGGDAEALFVPGELYAALDGEAGGEVVVALVEVEEVGEYASEEYGVQVQAGVEDHARGEVVAVHESGAEGGGHAELVGHFAEGGGYGVGVVVVEVLVEADGEVVVIVVEELARQEPALHVEAGEERLVGDEVEVGVHGEIVVGLGGVYLEAVAVLHCNAEGASYLGVPDAVVGELHDLGSSADLYAYGGGAELFAGCGAHFPHVACDQPGEAAHGVDQEQAGLAGGAFGSRGAVVDHRVGYAVGYLA